MTVAALSSAGLSQYLNASSNLTASEQAWQSVQQSLATGNLSGAQSAFNTYQQINQNLNKESGSSSTTADTQLTTDMKALGSAISSGDLSTAQSAFATAQTQLQSTPSLAIQNVNAAVAQSVQWVEDVLNLSSSNNNYTTAITDPMSSILDSVYGLNTSTSTSPTTSILNSAYGGTTSSGSTTSGSSSVVVPLKIHGNEGSSASVNSYA